MTKTVILITSLMLFTTSIYSAESSFVNQIGYNSDSVNNVKIKQTGNRVKINVKRNSNTINNQSIYSDEIPNQIYDDTTVIQNIDGNVDVVRVQNKQNSSVNTNLPNSQKGLAVGAGVGALSIMGAIAYAIIADPYAVKINGQKYYMVRNREDNQYTKYDILGYDDTKAELFDDMKSLNSDNDTTKITQEELKKAGIRFVAVVNNKLQLQDKSLDYSLDNIKYIDLTTLRGTVNNGKIGSFGYFDMYIKENNKTKKIIGFVTFDSDEDLNEMVSQ